MRCGGLYDDLNPPALTAKLKAPTYVDLSHEFIRSDMMLTRLAIASLMTLAANLFSPPTLSAADELWVHYAGQTGPGAASTSC